MNFHDWVTEERIKHFIDMYHWYKDHGRVKGAWEYLHCELITGAYSREQHPRWTMKFNPENISSAEIKRELADFAWEYIAAADKAQTDEQYEDLTNALDSRLSALKAELTKRGELIP